MTDLSHKIPNVSNQSLVSFQKAWLELCSTYGEETIDEKFTQMERDCYQFVFSVAYAENKIIDMLETKLKLNRSYLWFLLS